VSVNFVKEFYVEQKISSVLVHGENNCAEIFKNLARYRIILNLTE